LSWTGSRLGFKGYSVFSKGYWFNLSIGYWIIKSINKHHTYKEQKRPILIVDLRINVNKTPKQKFYDQPA